MIRISNNGRKIPSRKFKAVMARILSAVFFLIFAPVLLCFGAPVKDAHVEADIVPLVSEIQPGFSFIVNLSLKMDRGWHTYWRNPGDSGLATSIEWKLPAGFESGDILWPVPKQIPAGPLMTYGYEGKVVLPVWIKVPPEARAGQNAPFEAHVEWLACKVDCIPGQADFNFSLPVTASSANATKTESKPGRFPVQDTDLWKITAKASREWILFQIRPRADEFEMPSNIYFFPYAQDLIRHPEPQRLSQNRSAAQLWVKRSPLNQKTLSEVEGLFVADRGWLGEGNSEGLSIKVSVENVSRLVPPPLAESNVPSELPMAVVFAFLGGIILNLMPCVLPVLSLKILHLTQQPDQKSLRWQGIFYSLGVIFSFVILAVIFEFFKNVGYQLGWGFQLQSPGFVTLLAVLFYVLGLNLSGFFEFGSLAPQSMSRAKPHGFFGPFFSGILITLVATPCTAPFMGAALGYVLSRSFTDSVWVFFALGCGMAAPYFLISFFPFFSRWIPKPGAWMITLKKVLALPLYATSLWLISVLIRQTGFEIWGFIAAGFILIFLGLWIFGRAYRFSKTTRRILTGASFFLLAAGTGLALHKASMENGISAPAQNRSWIDWQKYDELRISELRNKGVPVFTDFTAAWCLTCQVNESIALNRKDTAELFKEKGVVAFKADWTRHDTVITKALSRFGRRGVPLYVYYGPGSETPPVVLPEILLPSVIRKFLGTKE